MTAANDNSAERYSIRRQRLANAVQYWGEHYWRVFDGNRAVSIGFATYRQAVRCRAVLQALDRAQQSREAATHG